MKRGRRVLFAALGVVAAIALVTTGYAVFQPAGEQSAAIGPVALLPTLPSAPAPSLVTPPPASSVPAEMATSPTTPRTSAAAMDRSRETTTGAAGTPTTKDPITVRPKPPTTTQPEAPLAPPTDRVVIIRNLAGFCLDLNGAVTNDGNHVQLTYCNGTGAQVWTMGADSTLRVLGRCAGITGDSTVRIAGCDGRAASLWRTGDRQALVNPASGLCLTDPQNGANLGRALTAETCDGRTAQRWTIS